MEKIVSINKLDFGYNNQNILKNINLEIHNNERILLFGSNGAGKSTLLKIIGGLNIVKSYSDFSVLGKSIPNDQCGGLAYLGDRWERSTPFCGMSPYTGDIRVGDMMKKWQEEHIERRDELVKVLDIDLDWRMHTVSDGQRKKVQIMLGLLYPFRLLVIDEFLNSLDIIVRDQFYQYIEKECQNRGASVIYATHIFDNLEKYMNKVLYIKDGSCSSILEMDVFLKGGSLFQAVKNVLINDTNSDNHIAESHNTGYSSGRFKNY
tara:strand:- start:490 stop:1278 length:789 start_codon:yes stop_codon:yes gene_type:complete